MRFWNRFSMVGVSLAIVCSFSCGIGGHAWAYEYDTENPTQGAGVQAPWRATARWDLVDEEATKDIHTFTTDPEYLTPLVSYIPEDAAIPSPRDFLSYIAGAEGKLTHPEDEVRYFEALAAASPRVTLFEMGETEEGRMMHLVVVSAEENLSRLDEFKSYTAALADPRNVNEAQAAEIIAKAKPIMHVTGGLHSPETGSPEMLMELAYRLAVSKHPDIEEIRRNVVLLITPVLEVDGRAKMVEWYYRHLTEYDNHLYTPDTSPPYWGRYVYHDNNRDGLQMTQKLTQNFMKAFLEWHPTYSLDLHESVPFLYVSGGTGPYNPNLDPIVIREWQWVSHWELAELQKHNMPGVWTWGFFTGWNPSYLLWITNNHNSLGRFYETFGNASARTMERDLSDEKFLDKEVTSKQWYRADPPEKKVVWSLRNNTNYMQSGVLASLKLLARNGDTMLHNFWKKGCNSLERGRQEAPHGWVIPREQRDPSRLAYLVNQLLRQDIEVHRATKDFELEDGEFKSGDFVVRTDQPYSDYVRNLLQIQKFPKDAEHRPYDDVSWALGLHYRVDTTPIEDKAILELANLEIVEGPVAFEGWVDDEEEPAAYAVKHEGNNPLITARYRLERYEVLAVEEPFTVGDEEFPIGSWIIPTRRRLKENLEEIARECALDFKALSAMPEATTHSLDLPRVALYHTWASTQNDGWVRYTLEQAGVPFDYINDDDIRSGGLRAKYDVILVAHVRGSAKSMVHGLDPKFGPMSYTPTREFPSHGRVDSDDDITGGFGFKGLANLETYLDKGGTLLLMGAAGQLATDMGLLRNVGTLAGGKVSTPGSAIQTKVVRRDHPIAYGYEDVHHVFRVNGPVYTVPEEYDHWIVVQYGTKALRDEEEDDEEKADADEEPEAEDEEAAEEDGSDENDKDDADKMLLSGYVSGASDLEKKAVVLDVPRHRGGRVILYSFNPLHRHLNHGDHNYVYNAILNWNDFPDPEPKDHPGLATD